MPDQAIQTAAVVGPASVEAPASQAPSIPGLTVNFLAPMAPVASPAPAQSAALASPAPVAPTAAPAVAVAPASAPPAPAPEDKGKPTYSQLAAKVAEFEAAQLRRDVEAAVMAKANPAQAKIVRGLLAGIKLEGESAKAAESALASLTQDYPELFASPGPGVSAAPQSAQPVQAAPLPSLPAAVHSPNGVQVQRIGIYDSKGVRVL